MQPYVSAIRFPVRLIAATLLLTLTAPLFSCSPDRDRSASDHLKSGSILIDAEMRQNALQNIEQFPEAQDRLEELRERVQPFMEMDLEELWLLLPSQEMTRARWLYSQHSANEAAAHSLGCPQCMLDHDGGHVGPDQSEVDLLNRPWQVQCQRCGTWFPKNDFASYYESARDETGRFRPGTGDSRYLEPREDAEGEARHWIDDGTGLEYEGYLWFPAARYADELWRELAAMSRNLGLLYTLTEDPEYARRAAVILDRMADLFPEMDERPHRETGTFTSYGPGRIMGRGWEYMAIRIPVAEAYDYIYDAIREDEELVGFLDRISQEYRGADKSTFQAVDHHIRENLLVDFIEDIMESREDLQRGRAQTAMAIAAVALDDPDRSPEWIDWMFDEEGGRLPYTLIEHMHRDGFNVESGISAYMTASGRVMHRIAEILSSWSEAEMDMYRDYPNLLNSYTMLSRTRVLDKTEPAAGDGGSSMQMEYSRYPFDMLMAGYLRFGDEEIAREIILNDPDNWEKQVLDNAIYHEDPAGLVETIRQQTDGLMQESHRSFNSGGTGFAVLQAPDRPAERAAGIWYGRTSWPSHTHFDRLALHLWAFDETLMPDAGYPEYAGNWPRRFGFTRHTVSHNTVMIDDQRQGSSYGGKTRLFADAGPIRMADIDGLGSSTPVQRWDQSLYPQADTYRRAAVMVDVDENNSYLLDLFWVRGGSVHRLIQNGPAPEATLYGLQTTRQESGTLAGPDIEYEEEFDGELTVDYSGSGFQYFTDLERDLSPPETFRINWAVDPRYEKPDGWQANLRLHNLTSLSEVALADGMPARGHPERIRYSFRERSGEDLSSQFVSVLEPWGEEPFIEEVELLKGIDNGDEPFSAAIQVTLADGRRDLILVREEPGTVELEEYLLEGRLGLIRHASNGEVEKMVAVAADRLEAGDLGIEPDRGSYRGELVSFDDSDPHNVRLHLSRPVGEDAVGEYIIFDNRDVADGSYRIHAVEDERTVNIGQMPLFERFVDPDDFDRGVAYNLEAGESYVIPRTAVQTFRDP